MTSLLSVYSADGYLGSCNARCYNCKQPSDTRSKTTTGACVCVCGGANHGVGLNRAMRNIVERHIGLRDSDLAAYAAINGKDPACLTVVNRLHYPTYYRAKKIARIRLRPPPPLPLFECNGLATAPISEAPEPASGPGAGAATNTASTPGDPTEKVST
jgi:hypothetical protein